MNAEVDISGRIEETNRPSALALTNGTSISICLFISAKEKRTVLEVLKQRKPERRQTLHHLFIYSTLIFLAIREHHESLDQVTIDLEYAGHEGNIRLYILNLCLRYKISLQTEIVFRSVGKKSPAHALAIEVFRGKKADKIVTAEEILREYP